MHSIKERMEDQQRREGPKPDLLRPLDHPVKPQSHTALYRMHRYYARRPHNVFAQLIQHYSEAGKIILDPFCGGGVTVVEGLKLDRKVIGVDLNPLATFVTRMQVTPLDLDLFEKAFNEVLALAKKALLPLYQTFHPETKAQTIAEWYEWSNVYRCPHCEGAGIIIEEAKKLRGGIYACPFCEMPFQALKAEKTGTHLLRLQLPTTKKGSVFAATDADRQLAQAIEAAFDQSIAEENLWYPKDSIPNGDVQHDNALFKKGFTQFSHFFTKRNLLANARLLKIIQAYQCDASVKGFLYFCFSDSLRFTNVMTARNEGWRAGNPEWGGHTFWLPNVFCEANVYAAFSGRLTAVMRGKAISNEEIGAFCQFAQNYEQLNTDKTCFILNQSSHQLPLPDHSIEAIITDPPFGGNVQYAELSDFFVVWLKDALQREGIIDNSFEAIQTRHRGFATAKSLNHYEEMLYRIFKEGHRVLKEDGWLVMTFHNRDVNVWMALHRAANRAGFKLPLEEESPDRGMIYQPPVELYTRTFHQRAAGSMLGDFILSFKRLAKVPIEEPLQKELSHEQREQLKTRIEDLIYFHGGADDTVIMSGLIPALSEMDIFHRLAHFDWEPFLASYFTKDSKTGKWFTKDLYDAKTKKLRPLDYIPAQEVTRGLIIALLKEKGFATVDDILIRIYSRLVNSHRPGIEAIQTVLSNYCEQSEFKKKKGYVLKPEAEDLDQNLKPTLQLGLFNVSGNVIVSEFSHNQLIYLLADYALKLGYTVHIGETEQRKEPSLRAISTPLLRKEDWGIAHAKAFEKIREIDLLVLHDREIPLAIEVATTIETADKAINSRFRDLFSILPNTRIKAFVVVKDEDFRKGLDIVCSAANVQQRISERVKIIKMSQLTSEKFKELLA